MTKKEKKKKNIVVAFYHQHNLRAMTMILVLYKHRDEIEQTIITSPLFITRKLCAYKMEQAITGL